MIFMSHFETLNRFKTLRNIHKSLSEYVKPMQPNETELKQNIFDRF